MHRNVSLMQGTSSLGRCLQQHGSREHPASSVHMPTECVTEKLAECQETETLGEVSWSDDFNSFLWRSHSSHHKEC